MCFTAFAADTTEWQTEYLEAIWQMVRVPALGISPRSHRLPMIEKTLRNQTTSERLLFSSWFIMRIFPQWALRALLTPVQMQKQKKPKLSPKLVARLPREMCQRTNINLVNALDPGYKRCCALKVWIQWDMNELEKDTADNSSWNHSNHKRAIF